MKKAILIILFLLSLSAYSLADDFYFAQDYSTTPLDGDEVYSSSCMNVRNYKTVNVNLISDQDSATGGVDIKFYNDSSCANLLYSANTGGWSYTAGTDPESYAASVRGEYAKVTYTNGASNQTSFVINIFLTK